MAAEPMNEVAEPIEAEDLRDRLDEAVRERDAYREAALRAETNELNLHRRLNHFLEDELAQLSAEVRALRRTSGGEAAGG